MITTLREVMIANVRLNMFPQDEKGGNLISAATCSHAIMPSCGPCPRYIQKSDLQPGAYRNHNWGACCGLCQQVSRLLNPFPGDYRLLQVLFLDLDQEHLSRQAVTSSLS